MENLNSCEFLEGLSCYQPFEHITCRLTTFRRPNWPISCGYICLLPKVTLWVIALGWDRFGFPVRFSPQVTLQIITQGQLLTWQYLAGILIHHGDCKPRNIRLACGRSSASHTPIFASSCLKLNFKLFFLTDVGNYCEERKIKLSVNVYIQIARNLGSNFLKFFSNFLDFWQFFSNFLAFQWATFQQFTSTIGIGLVTIRYDLIRHDSLRPDSGRHDSLRPNTSRFATTWFGPSRFVTTWSLTIPYDIACPYRQTYFWFVKFTALPLRTLGPG